MELHHLDPEQFKMLVTFKPFYVLGMNFLTFDLEGKFDLDTNASPGKRQVHFYRFCE